MSRSDEQIKDVGRSSTSKSSLNSWNLLQLGQTWGICTWRAGKLYKARSRLYRSKQASKQVRSVPSKKKEKGTQANRAQLNALKPNFASKYSLELAICSKRRLRKGTWGEKTLAGIYTMHSFAPFWNRIPKNEENHGGKRSCPIPGKQARRSS